MSNRKIFTFKGSSTLHEAILDIMEERQIDQTSVMKLALYMFVSYMHREQTRHMTLHELVADIEHNAPPDSPSFSHFVS